VTDPRSSNGQRFLLRAAGGLLALACAGGAVLAKPSFEEPAGAGPVVYHARRALAEIVIDGHVDEPAWADALRLELDYEVSPGENVPPPVRTDLLVAYDDSNVYFAFKAYDPDPARIRARYSDRDKAWSDDWVGVVLDTFNDQRRAYELLCNPLGVQMDALNDDVLENYDDSWNAIWRSAGRITEQGYEVEMAVPFHQIRFQSSNGDAQTWGFDAIRSYPRGDRHHIGLFPRMRGNNSYLGQAVKLIGMEGASPGKNLELLPTLIASRTDAREELPDGAMEKGDTDPEVGATLRWGITNNVSLNGALNPDFSQVEADVLQLDINEQFALFFPETRPFFLEGADYFNTPLNLVHTRSVLDPSLAAKVTGKQGRHTYGLFTAQDDVTSMLFPGPEESSSDTFQLETTGTVGRYRYDFGKNSTVGATLTDRRGGGYSNQVASIDTRLRINEADRITASLSASRSRYAEEMIESAGVGGETLSDEALQVEYLHTKRGWWVLAEYGDLGDGFRADMGFLPQVGYERWAVSGARVWWGEEGDFHRRLAWGGSTGRRTRQGGELLGEYVESWVNLNGPRESFLSVDVTAQNQRYDGVDFEDQIWVHTWYEIQAAEDLNLVFHQDFGDWIDYTHARPAKRTLVQPALVYNLGRHLLLRYNHTYSALRVDGGRLFRVHAPEVRVVYQFNTRTFVRAVLQYTDIRRNAALYEDEVEPRAKDLFTQLLFTYKVNPQTALYVGYTDSRAGAEEYGLTPASRSLFVKLGYAWVR